MSRLSRQKYSMGGYEMETSNFAHISCPKLSESYRPMVPGDALRICVFQENHFFYYISPQMRCDLMELCTHHLELLE